MQKDDLIQVLVPILRKASNCTTDEEYREVAKMLLNIQKNYIREDLEPDLLELRQKLEKTKKFLEELDS